ncbi:MAG: yajC [Nocardioidaceae bacterium]|nr:yajC [Nocardioidaceae bacterium]
MSSQYAPIALLVILLLVFYLVVLRPARRSQQETAQLQHELEVGDEVVLSAGIFGTVQALEESKVLLEIAPGTVITVARQVVVRRVEDLPETPPADEHDDEHPDNADGRPRAGEE